MEKVENNQIRVRRNPILEYWEAVHAEKSAEAAIFSPDGTVLRTFSEIEAEASRWANRFGKLSAGAVIALQTGNTAEIPALVLGAWRAGCCVLLCDRDLKGKQREHIEELCGVQARIERNDTECHMVEVGSAPISWPGEAPDLLKLTSGTTGEPRAIRFSAAQLLADCNNVCETMGISNEDLNYGVISFTHSYGFSNLITPLICRGVRMVAATDVLPRAVMEGLRATRATVLPGVPALFRHLGEFAPDFCPPRLCISAGAPLTKEVALRFQDRWIRKVHTFYGASECGGICYDDGEGNPPDGYVGGPLKNVHITLEDAITASQGTVRSAAVGMGYWPVQSDDSLHDGVFEPADLLDRQGDGYVIVGRISDMINVAGRKVNPAEIERVLRGCPGVRDVAVVGLPSPLRGEEVAACIVSETTESALREYCARLLPGWQTPKKWKFCETLPVNSRGKLSRAALQALFIE